MLEFYVRTIHFLTMPPRKEEDGATAVEYGLLVALIAAVIVSVVVLLGNKIDQAFSTVNNAI